MTTRMLIDARHREETRVAVVKNNRIEEFDFESAERKQLKGNIYLAKVTRVEPSLQAAFVDYGGNRHGFLAFSEIHPDYYQIPKEDRDALLAEEAEHAAEEAALRAEQDFDDDEDQIEELDHDEGFEDDDHEGDDLDAPAQDAAEGGDQPQGGLESEGQGEGRGGRKRRGKRGTTDDQVEALRDRRMSLRRRYKIQDVIRRRQVLLVQIVKEERGNKGAALTSYLSLAGRYCVLMPNTSNGGGISRKISSSADRKRLKSIMADMQLPPSMGCIVRTAGLQRTKIEIKRDFDYLARLWDEIRDKTLSSSAPALVYGDSDLLKRAIRDIYNKDIDEVIVEGGDGYRQAKDFMRLLMPSHARKVKQYADSVPLFQRSHVEEQLAGMYNPVVQLKSGGYLVINPTEALVSIDVNSGRSTREHNIEQTATATNLEASAEVARQLRLRDMAGLVVIDFIDMDNSSNNRKVEKAMKDALKDDRARIQIGRISSFGLMEMSRQRLRTGVLEASTRGCPHCEGTGLVRTASSAGLSALRMIEEEAARGRGSCLTLRASQEATIYVLNRKRADIAEIEERYGVQVEILPDREEEGARMSVEASGPPPMHPPRIDALVIEEEEDDYVDEPEVDEAEINGDYIEETVEAVAEPRAPRTERREDEAGEGGRKRRRRRGRGRGRRDEEQGEQVAVGEGEVVDEAPIGASLEAGPLDESGDEGAFAGEQPVEGDEPQADGEGRRRRGRRGRRGGRRGDRPLEAADEEVAGEERAGAIDDEPGMLVAAGMEPEFQAEPQAESQSEPDIIEAGDAGVVTTALAIVAPTEDAPRTRRRPRARKPVAGETAGDAPSVEAAVPAMAEAPVEEAPAPKRSRRKASPAADAPVAEVAPASDAEPDAGSDSATDAYKPRRARRKKADASEVEGAEPQPVDPGTVEAKAVEAEPELTLIVGQDGTLPDDAPNEGAESDDQPQGEAVPATAQDATTEDASAEPRRGWWQRTFGA